MSVAQIREAIAELSAEEREELAGWLAEESANSGIELEEEDSDLQLAHERLAALAAGTKKLIPENEFWARINAFKTSLK